MFGTVPPRKQSIRHGTVGGGVTGVRWILKKKAYLRPSVDPETGYITDVQVN